MCLWLSSYSIILCLFRISLFLFLNFVSANLSGISIALISITIDPSQLILPFQVAVTLLFYCLLTYASLVIVIFTVDTSVTSIIALLAIFLQSF